MIRAVIYARYSTDHQREESIDDQVEICRRAIEAQGWTLVRVYDDRAISGGSRFRPGYEALIRDADAKAFDVVVAESLDRLSRRLADIAALHDQLTYLGIRLFTPPTGEITPMHIGLIGTMSQMFVADLVQKIRRGQLGRIRAGKSPGGLPYGYDIADDGGERGGRRINPAEAAIVRRIFEEYVAGSSPRTIAKRLNEEGVPGPSGQGWRDTTIRGQVDRGTGFLNNEIYTGRLVWNRCKFVKNPKTGKRLPRVNPPETWEVTDVPEQRIIPDALWEAAKARQEAIRHVMTAKGGAALNEAHRPRFLLSGLLKCGACGGGYTITGKDRYGCATHRSKGTCANGLSIKRQPLEERVFAGLQNGLMAPEMVEEFTREFHAELNRQAREGQQQKAERQRELQAVTRKVSAMVDAIEAGAFNSSVKERLDQLERRKSELENALASASTASPVRIHPNVAKIYRKKAEQLEKLFEDETTKDEAFTIVRSLIDRVVLTPTDEGLIAELHGDLAGILTLCEPQKSQRPTADAVRRQLSVVAEEGLEPPTKGL